MVGVFTFVVWTLGCDGGYLVGLCVLLVCETVGSVGLC